MTREEWIDRYAKRVTVVADWTPEEARHAAEAGADVYEQNERAAHNALAWENPEDEADEEMSYWTNDGGDE